MEIKTVYDGRINIATGRSRSETKWKNQELLWSEFISQLAVTSRTGETQEEYKRLSKAERDEIKDVGGFVGGTLRQGKRNNACVVSRSILTLDLDDAHPDFWEAFTLQCDYAACVYSTHKHSPDKPRLRLIIPLARKVTAEEYEAIGHRIAGDLGIEQFDGTGFEPARLMYYPSTSRGAEYVFEYQDGKWLSPDEVLARYHDWRDVSEWIVGTREKAEHARIAKRQGDPTEKVGLIGAFCRAYTVSEAIETFLTDIYSPTEKAHRYSYVHGSTTCGLIVYDSDKFAYSHHATDPAGGKLCNAFDLVRLHKFGDLDAECAYDAPTQQLPSYAAMIAFASKDTRVSRALSEERTEKAKQDFSLQDAPEPRDCEWQKKLKLSDRGGIKQTIDNALLILENDPYLKNAIWHNEFTGRIVLRKSVPWRKLSQDEKMYEDADDAGLRHYLEEIYQLTVKTKIDDAVSIVCSKNTYHPVKEYLDGLRWDGMPRVERLFIDYLGADDSAYVRTTTRKTLAAAVGRIYQPGIKFDTMLILIGKQGIGKSYLLSRLGKKWYSDSLSSVDKGKDSYEQLQGYWLIEMSELNAMRKKEAEDVKGFLSKREDIFRVAYGKHTACFPRQCIFFGTTNSMTFLTDPTGNRRFFPIDLGTHAHANNPWDLSEYEIDQIWAEAKSIYESGETLYLTGDLAKEAEAAQAEHVEDNPKRGQIAEYLDRLLPEDWYKRDIPSRRMYILSEFAAGSGRCKREDVCIGEIWVECFGKDRADMRKCDITELHAIMQGMEGWKIQKTMKRFGEYGMQRLWYQREGEEERN